MSILATIRDHSGRIYRCIQALLLLSLAAAGLLLPSVPDDWHFNMTTLSMAATAASLLMLMYMRRAVVNRLRAAAAIEREQLHLLTTDPMTGAMSRHYFLEALTNRIGSLRNRREATLVLFDLDHFKQLNDTFGHQFGDNALRHLVKVANEIFEGCTIGRLGGDEFGILITHTELGFINQKLRTLMARMREGKPHEGKIIPLSVSAGIAMAPRHASNTSELVLLADLALYESKAAGRGRATVFEQEMQSEKRYRRLIERELRAAVYLDELEMHYQPIVDGERSTRTLEGLLRWRHPVRGLIPPSEFIPIAEGSILIDMLGEWVFRRACADIVNFPGCRIAINISGEQLKRDEVVAMFERVLAETGQRASRFNIEITETVATAATPEILKRMEALRTLGFGIALDDFGTGYCGFNYLKTLPVDSIKIDRSYIRNLAHDRVAQIFVSALAQIARIQDMTIVAEGVETAEELALAKAAGCNRFQGYLIGRPSPLENAQSGKARAREAEPLALTA